jgi:hypothetical protein
MATSYVLRGLHGVMKAKFDRSLFYDLVEGLTGHWDAAPSGKQRFVITEDQKFTMGGRVGVCELFLWAGEALIVED